MQPRIQPAGPRWPLRICLIMTLAAACLQAQTLPFNSRQSPAVPIPAQTPGPASDLTISPDDVLDVAVLDIPELSRQYRVGPAGTIVLPLLDMPVLAAGLKVTEFSGEVSKKLRDSGMVANPSVVVSIAASRLKSVAITGAVRMPQIYPLFGSTTLLDVLSQAQGLADDAGSVAVISRAASSFGGRAEPAGRTETVDLRKLLETGESALNLEIYPGDRVTVPRAGIVYVVGAVNKPGGFTIKSTGEGLTVLQAVALAEGLKPTAVRDKVAVIRNDPAGGHVKLPLNLKTILAGKAEDPVLQATDILFIPDSEGAKAFRRGIEAVLQTATGVVIYRR